MFIGWSLLHRNNRKRITLLHPLQPDRSLLHHTTRPLCASRILHNVRFKPRLVRHHAVLQLILPSRTSRRMCKRDNLSKSVPLRMHKERTRNRRINLPSIRRIPQTSEHLREHRLCIHDFHITKPRKVFSRSSFNRTNNNS